MKRFTKLIMLLMVASTLFIGCKEDVTIDDQQAALYVDMGFDLEALGEQFSGLGTANKNSYNTKADGTGDVISYPLCVEDGATHVRVELSNGDVHELAMTSLTNDNGKKNETEVIKVLAGSYTIVEFEVFNGATAIYSAPHGETSQGAGDLDQEDIDLYQLRGLPYTFTLGEFTKTKIAMDVVCWHEYSYQPLAWNWYELNYHQKKTLCFFGDTCSKFFPLWNAEGYDFVTPFRIDLYEGGVVNGTLVASAQNFTNGVILPGAEGNPLCVEYIDDELQDEELEAVISMLMPDGSVVELGIVDIAEGAWSGDGLFGSLNGDDGIYDFTVGSCTSGDADNDYVFPFYVPLPTDPIKFNLGGATSVPGTGQSFYSEIQFDLDGGAASATTIGEWTDGVVYAAFCGDATKTIGGGWITGTAWSSLDPNLPADYKNYPWGKLNWLANNLGNFSDAEIQGAVWRIIHGANRGLTVAGLTDIADANFVPKVGDFIFVLIDGGQPGADMQLIVVQVDP